ncbi:hypothetical protein CK820_G0056777 [Pan troglodytes]|nr:hypothetical protein CK820_G0056777 [Pan troglodytes]
MTSLYGQLAGLKELGLLDCVSYITGASGSTWALANLYEDTGWSQKDLAGPTELLKTQVTKNKLGVLAPSQLQRYRQELAERARLGYPSCFTNLWALINEALLHDEPHDHKLSDQREALSHGQNPLPIYCALNTKGQSLTTFEFGEWCEFSPYEVGFPKYGAFIPSELFGSEFFMGQLMKRLPDPASALRRYLEQPVCSQPPGQLILGLRAQPVLGPLGQEPGQPGQGAGPPSEDRRTTLNSRQDS